MATGRTGGRISKYGGDAQPPGNALLATEVAAQKRQDAGLNPTASPVHAADRAVHALIHGTGQPASASFGGAHINAPTAFTPVTLGLSTLLDLPNIVGGAHHQAVALAHPSAANPPGLGREVHALISGALGIPRMGVDEPKKVYPPGTLYHGSPEGQIGKVDALWHTKAWREGPGFYLTSDQAKAAKYAAGKTASAARKGGEGAINAFRIKPGTKVLNLDAQPQSFWHSLAESVAGKVDPAVYAEWAKDIGPEDAKGASEGILNRLRLMHFLTGYEEMPKTDAYYAIEDALHESGVQATLHHEGGVPVHIVKDASVLERVQPTVPHPLISAKPTIQKGPAPTVNTLGQAVTGGLKGARGARGEQEIARSAERGARADAFGKALQGNPTVRGAATASKLLAGKYPEVRFGGFSHFTPEAQDAAIKAIADHPLLKPFEQKRATDAIRTAVAGKTPTDAQEKMLRHVFGDDMTNDLMKSVSSFKQLKALGYDVANIPRSVMASYDASGILRQALMIATSHPGVWAKNVPEYVKAIKSEDVYNAGMAAVHQRPNALNGVYEKMGVDFAELTPRGSAAAREESFRSPLAERIFGVRQSGRGYTLFLDNARADVADQMYAKAVKNEGKIIRRVKLVNGKPRIVKQAVDPNDPKLLESIGTVVNSMSGRGDLGQGPIGKSQEALNLLLFSPRLIKSRVDFLNPVWYAKLDPLARHEAYRALGGLVMLTATALGIGKVAGASVNLDPRSSDFAKIKFGNTRIDMAGGFQQYTRILSEILTQQTVNSAGKVANLGGGHGQTSDLALVMRFLRSKLAPVASAITDVGAQRNAINQPLTFSNSVVSRLTPLTGQDAVSVGRDVGGSNGIPAGVLAGLGAFGLSAVGAGVQNYTPKKPKVRGSNSGGSDYGGSSGGGGSDYGGGSSGGSDYGG